MPRIARIKSKTAVYHIMMRGNNRQKVFHTAADKDRMTEIIFKKITEDEATLYAYCIMDNHQHLVMKEGKTPISQTIKRIGTSYAWFYNKKYGKVGHVFQDRFKSEAIESEKRLLAAVRYVHMNPVKAGIADLETYKWSSYHNYLGSKAEFSEGTKQILLISSHDLNQARDAFTKFHSDKSDEDFIDIKELSREEAAKLIDDYLKKACISKDQLKSKDNRLIRETLVEELAQRSEFSLREIASVLGLNREIVRIIMSKEPSL
jgi:putative transposase